LNQKKKKDTTVTKEKQALLEQALTCAKEALALNDEHWLAHKWVAVVTSSLVSYILFVF
jgi:hypothetical protein